MGQHGKHRALVKPTGKFCNWRNIAPGQFCRTFIGGAILLGATLGAFSAQAACRQALALGLDVSGSVDKSEYRLQLDGLAAALSDPAVQKALLATPAAPVALAVYEWSGVNAQRIVINWTAITDAAVLARVIARLKNTQRKITARGTALGTTISVGSALLQEQSTCWKRTLDISGDGKSNVGPHPRISSQRAEKTGITINALVIGADAPKISDRRQVEIAELSSYFRAYVIAGPNAFVETALGFEEFEAAMTRKLLKELEELVVSGL